MSFQDPEIGDIDTMKPVLLSLMIVALVMTAHLGAQPMPERAAKDFVADLIERPKELEEWASPDELARSRRLGISYRGVSNKFLISYDVTNEIRYLAKESVPDVEFEIKNLDDGYSLVSLTFADGEHNVEYYFLGDRLVSPIHYHSRDWSRLESGYFVFFSSDSRLFNNYTVERLNEFVTEVLEEFDTPQHLRTKLKDAKIYYFLCSGTDEIRDLTGFNTRGMYNLAYDYIITTYNCHYHELVHLLVNYRLQDNFLDTHPFFQEGIAVALGGRGGKEPSVIADLGAFLEQSQIATYQDLMSFESFINTDPSLSYPLSGLYNAFLINESGAGDYLALYKEYSGAKGRSDILESDLPPVERWQSYLRAHTRTHPIGVRSHRGPDCEVLYGDSLAEICQDTGDVHFNSRAYVLLSKNEIPEEYVSKLFQERFPYDVYRGEKYLITADENEISVYNLYTNNLVAKYVPSMSTQKHPIIFEKGFFRFSVDRSVFDEDLREMTIKVVPTVR